MKKSLLISFAAAGLLSLGLATANTQSVKAAGNAADLMTYLSKSKSLSKSQRSSASTAAHLLKTGRLGKKAAPSWYKEYVNLNAEKDATSSANIKAVLPYLSEVNSARHQEGAHSLKVSPVLMAASMLNADYQKRGGLKHSHYFKFLGLENLSTQSASLDPVQNWLEEKKNWEFDTKKNPSLKKNKYVPVWNSTYDAVVMGSNGYKTAGHYLNLINKKYRVMGFGNVSDTDYGNVDSFMGSNKGAGISVGKYKTLVNAWLNK